MLAVHLAALRARARALSRLDNLAYWPWLLKLAGRRRLGLGLGRLRCRPARPETYRLLSSCSASGRLLFLFLF